MNRELPAQHFARIARLAFLVALGWSAAPSTLVAQSAGSPDEPGRGFFRLDHLAAELRLDSQYEQTRVRPTGNNRDPHPGHYTDRGWILKERLGFDLAGSIVDPGFIAYAGTLDFGLSQDHYYERTPLDTRSDGEWGRVLNYDLGFNFLRGRPISGSAYGRRVDDRIARRFQPTLDERRTGWGTAWSFSHDRLPMELSYDYLETDRTGNIQREDDEHYTDSSLHYGGRYLISDNHRLDFSYDHSEHKQEHQGLTQSFETTRDLLELDHEISFGGGHQHDLRTQVHWQEESGDFARDFFEIGPQLTLRHRDDFQTSYEYQFNSEEYEQFRINQHRADFQFIHQLYSNLTTTGNLWGSYEDIDRDVTTYEYGANIDWQYNRGNPLGRFSSNLALAGDKQHVHGDNGLQVVLNESGTFIDPIAITLYHPNVARGSIVVTDDTNLRFFRPGTDYIAVRQGVWTRLFRVPTGRIADRQTLLIDYLYETPADGRTDTVRVDFGAEQRFEFGLTPYYLFDYRHQEVDSSTGYPVDPDRTDHHRIGVKYETERYFARCEVEIFDDVIEPYDAYHLDGRYRFLRTARHDASASMRFSRYFFEGGFDDRNVSVIDVELDHRWYVGDSLSATNRLLYRHEDDSADGNTDGVDLLTGLSYALGDLSLELTVEYDLLDLPGSREDGFGVWLTVRRGLFDVAPSR